MLLYNQLDAYHHSTRASVGVAEVQGMLDGLVEVAQTLFERCEREGISSTAFVSSDHGNTLLPPEQVPLPLPAATELLLDEGEEGERSSHQRGRSRRTRTRVLMANEQMSGITPEMEDTWWFLRGDLFNLPDSYPIPKSYASVGGRVTGWTHGGLTPEEVITPFIQLAPHSTSSLLPLELVFRGELRTTHSSTIDLLIENPNSVAITSMLLILPEYQIRHRLTIVKGYDKASVARSTLPPVLGSHESEDIVWEISGEARGHRYFCEGVEAVPVRRLQSRNEMDDLFGDL